MKKTIKVIVNLILICSLLLSIVGCEEEQQAVKSNFFVYYVDEDGLKLQTEPYTLSESDLNKQIMELINKLETKGTKEGNYSAIPEDVTVNGFNFSDGMVVVDFAEDYIFVDKQREVMCRASVVITLCQLEEVKYVAFTINDEPYMADGANILGAMQASDFVSDIEEVANNALKSDFILYFVDEEGTKLIPYTLTEAQYGNKTMERFVVEQLVAGPKEEGYIAPLSSDITINSVVTANGICYVDFGEDFLTEQKNVSSELVIYSIVNSISELSGIQKVQISVDGETNIMYRDNISLNDPFIRNLDLIKE